MSRMLMERGAASVLGAEISPDMVRRAVEQNIPPTRPSLRYVVLDARDEDFQLDPPVDVVTAMYLFHYEEDLEKMAHGCWTKRARPVSRRVTLRPTKTRTWKKSS